MDTEFSMDCDYWNIKITKADNDTVNISLEFKKVEIPEGELRKLERHLRLILEACGRLPENPTRR